MRKLMAVLGVVAIAQTATAAGFNSLILDQMRKMPSGGKYSVSHFAKIKLQSAAHFESGKFFVIPTAPYPSFCSGATYIVFIKTIEALRDSGQLDIDFALAQPGDFMKIFWNKNVGRRESGHSVIFLGTVNHPDGEYVRFWSSNIPHGYGEKEVPRSKIANAIFSRLETPSNLTRIRDVPVVDAYLASLLRKESNFAEARQKCGI